MAPHQNTSAESAIHFRIARPGVISTNGMFGIENHPANWGALSALAL